MAVRVYSDRPSALLRRITTAIDQGLVRNWEVDEDGDFTYTVPRWSSEAWMTPSVLDDRIVFNIVRPVGRELSTEAYAVYHGRLVELIIGYFDKYVSKVVVSALPERDDDVG